MFEELFLGFVFLLAVPADIMGLAGAGFFDNCALDFAEEDLLDFVFANFAFHKVVFEWGVFKYFVKIYKCQRNGLDYVPTNTFFDSLVFGTDFSQTRSFRVLRGLGLRDSGSPG